MNCAYRWVHFHKIFVVFMVKGWRIIIKKPQVGEREKDIGGGRKEVGENFLQKSKHASCTSTQLQHKKCSLKKS